MNQLHRRDIVRTGSLLGAAILLAGCQSTSRSRPEVTPAPESSDPDRWAYRSHKPEWVDDYLKGAPSSSVTGVIPRSAWTRSGPNLSDTNPMSGISRITVHHEGSTPFAATAQSAVAQRLESTRRAHVNANGWADIGYHYVVDPSGRVWEARPVALQGAHVKDNNEHNLGIMVLGNFEEQTPTPAALKSLNDFVVRMMGKYRVPVARVYTHQELKPTACPGRSLQRHMESARSRGGAIARA